MIHGLISEKNPKSNMVWRLKCLKRYTSFFRYKFQANCKKICVCALIVLSEVFHYTPLLSNRYRTNLSLLQIFF